MPIRDKGGKLRYSRQERNTQIMEMLFKFKLTSWRPSSHQIAIGLGLRPSHHVRKMLVDLMDCGMISMAEQTKENGRIVHRWSINLDEIEDNHPAWKSYLMDKFGIWPMLLF